MAQQVLRDVSTRPYGLGRNFRRAAQGLLFAGALLLASGLIAEAAAASNPNPQLNAQQASFTIPANNPATMKWTLNLWKIATSGRQTLAGTDTATSGTLTVAVPKTATCHFQVDLYRGVHYFSGYQKFLTSCGTRTVSTTTSSSSSTTSTTTKTTPTTSKPKTTGGSGVSSTVATKSGGSPTTSGPATKPGSSTSVPPSALAFTGVGIGMWVVAALGALLLLVGTGLLLYVRRYAKTS